MWQPWRRQPQRISGSLGLVDRMTSPDAALPLCCRCLQGACGYGAIPKDQYPYFSVAALSPSNQFYKAGPLNGCGECFQVQCTDGRAGVCNKDASGNPVSIVVVISGALGCPPTSLQSCHPQRDG